MPGRPYTTRAKRALDLADSGAAALGHEYVGTEHILLGLLDEQTGPAAQILAKLGVTRDQVQQQMHQVLGHPAA